MNTPSGPESEPIGGPSNQIVANSEARAISASAWSPPAPMWLDGAPGEEGIDFSVFLHCLRRKWLPGLLIGGTLAALVSAMLFFLIPVSFEAISLLRVNRSEPHVIRRSFSSDQEYVAYKQTQATLVTSPFVLSAALREPGITQLPTLQNVDNGLDWLTRQIRVNYPGDSEIMQVGMHGDRNDDIKKIVDAVVTAYLYEIGQSEKTEKSRKLQTLRAQHRRNDQLIKDKSEVINRLSEQYGSRDSETAQLRSMLEQDQLRSLSRQRTVAQEELARLMSDIYAMNIARRGSQWYKPDPKDVEMALQRDPLYATTKQNMAAIEQMLTSMQIGRSGSLNMANNPYQAEYVALQQTLEKRRAEFAPLVEHQLKREFTGDDSSSSTALKVLQGQAQFKKSQLDEIQRQYDEQLEKVSNLSGFSSDLLTKRQELMALQESNHELSREMSRLEVDLQAEDRIQRVQHATIPNEGSYFIKMVEVVGGGILTLFGALLAVTLWDYKAKRLNSTNDIQNAIRMPVIGTIPSLRGGITNLIGGRGASEANIADSTDSIRAAILYGGQGKKLKSVLVTSAVGHEGKSTVASQLAVSLARAGQRTLLVDADVRNPQQHAVFGLPLDRGLCDVIRGQATVEEVVQATPAEGLWILPAGRYDMAVMQAISGPALPKMMDRLESQFDFVIMDSGPVLTGPGAMICGQHVDAAVISTRRDVSQIPKIDEAFKRLQSVGVYVLGSVVNGTGTEVRSNQLSVTASAAS